MTQVLLVDYGVGNLLSVARALEACGASVELSGDVTAVRRAKTLVLPGVGAFGDCMAELRRRGLIDPLREFATSGRPFLGICVGMQVLMNVGEEFGEHEGLGVFKGRVRAIPPTTSEGRAHKIPHIGWTPLVPAGGNGWRGTILDETAAASTFYFVHSYTAWPDDETVRLADADYNGQRVAAVIRRGNAYGTQFHPEKSGAAGLSILSKFLALPT